MFKVFMVEFDCFMSSLKKKQTKKKQIDMFKILFFLASLPQKHLLTNKKKHI